MGSTKRSETGLNDEYGTPQRFNPFQNRTIYAPKTSPYKNRLRRMLEKHLNRDQEALSTKRRLFA
jgi:hypothetical protein